MASWHIEHTVSESIKETFAAANESTQSSNEITSCVLVAAMVAKSTILLQQRDVRGKKTKQKKIRGGH
jgi:hypothetical protein